MEIIIIGGGPAGLYCAHLLARLSFDVTVLEEHARIGEPVQCTGIVTGEMHAFANLSQEIRKATIREISTATVHAPSGKNVTFTLTANPVLDRAVFDRALAKKAEKAGATVRRGVRVLDIVEGCIRTDEGRYKPDIIIGADGPHSLVRRYVSSQKIGFTIGTQARIRDPSIDRVHFFPHIGRYAWLVPEERGIVRAGVVCERQPAEALKDFLKERGYSQRDVISRQAGLIPDHAPGLRTSFRKHGQRIFLVGDAATQVKATTGGGIIPGLIAAEGLCEAIEKDQDYERLWRKRVGRSLRAHLLIRRALSSFSVREYERLIGLVGQPRVRRIIEKADREYPLRYIMRLGLTEPRLALLCLSFLRPGAMKRMVGG